MSWTSVYRLALHLLPGELRTKHGPAMEALFERELDRARGRGRLQEAFAALCGIGDVVRRSGYEWLRPQPMTAQLLRRHGSSFAVAFVALTVSLVALFARNQVPELNARGASPGTIAWALLLAVPFTAAMTIPMAVFIAVLREFTRLRGDDTLAEARRQRSLRRAIAPVLGAAAIVAGLALVEIAEVVPRANTQLATLLMGRGSVPNGRTMTLGELRQAERAARLRTSHDDRESAAGYEVEVQKKFALPAACLVLALAGMAIALRISRRGAGLMLGASCAVFGTYYIVITTGETLARRLVVPPVIGMWSANALLLVIALLALRTRRAPRATTVTLAALLTAVAVPSPGRAQSTSAATEGYVAVDSSRLHYEECGSGPAIVLVHDGLMGAASWDLIWPELCRQAHVVRYDRRGVGRSSAPKIPFSQTADLEALMADRGLTSATLVGSSSGGGIAIDFALEHPARVERLILLGAVVDGLGFSAHFTGREMRNIEPLLRGDVAGAIRKELDDPFALEPGNTAVRERVRKTLTANPQNLQGLLTINRYVQRPAVPAAARLGELRVPALLLVGEHDIPDVHAHAGAIELGMGGARREIVPGGGHLIQLDHPALVGPRILAFIAETPMAVVPTERLQALAGTWTPVIRDQAGDFYVKDGRLMTHFAGSRDVPLFAANDSTFYAVISASRFQVSFLRDASGKISRADVTLNDARHSATRATADH